MNTPTALLPTSGTIPEEKIPCRTQEITQLVRLLRTQSITVEEMRRMGKTMLLKKMAYLCNTEQLPEEFKDLRVRAKYLSFQGKQNLGEVIDLLISELKDFKEWHQFDGSGIYNFLRGLIAAPEVEVAGFKLNVNLPELEKSWKEIFFKTLDEIAETQEKLGGILVLIFDELPIMLWNWYIQGKAPEAIELLDILRERRQKLEKQGVRFIYCGSIGIKVVLSTFRDKLKYTGEPTNEMYPFELKPFIEEDSNFLCECFLLSGFKITDTEKSTCWRLIFEVSNGLPFYISRIFNIIQTEYDYQINPSIISDIYTQLIENPTHNTAFKQLLERLDIYYPAEKAAPMKELLSVLSNEDNWITEDALYPKTKIDDTNELKDCLQILHSDHYLVRKNIDGSRAYQFKYSIFKSWWKVNIA